MKTARRLLPLLLLSAVAACAPEVSEEEETQDVDQANDEINAASELDAQSIAELRAAGFSEKEIKAVCTTGLDLVVGVIVGQIKALDIPLLKLEEGTAQMWDAPAPGQPLDAIVSRIDKGFWTASINAGGPTPKPVIATFTGKRLDDVPAAPPAAPK